MDANAKLLQEENWRIRRADDVDNSVYVSTRVLTMESRLFVSAESLMCDVTGVSLSHALHLQHCQVADFRSTWCIRYILIIKARLTDRKQLLRSVMSAFQTVHYQWGQWQSDSTIRF